MRRRLTSVLGVLVASLAMTAMPTTAMAAPAPAPAPPPAESIDWKPCEANARVECATVPVPVDWSKPDGETLDMAVARRKAGDPAQRIGSLVSMPGGPGGSGVSSIISGVPFSPEITEKFDVVSFDPRGIARSQPVKCDAELLQNPPELIPDGTGEQFKERLDYNRKLGESCRENSGALLDHVDNVSTARDVDALRAGLGEEKISLYGISYGTLTGQMYAENFPQHVRALVLDSVMDHSLGTRDFITTEASTAEDTFSEFGKWCASNKQCALHGEDAGAVFDKVYERAERGELHVPGAPKAPLSPVQLSSTAIGAAYGPSWGQLATYLKELTQQKAASVAPPPAEMPMPTTAFCADWNINIRSADQYAEEWEAQRKAAPHLRLGLGWTIAMNCVDFPAQTPNPQHQPEIKGTPPILIMNSQHDPATGYNWATNVDRQVDAATLLTYDGWGHGVYDRNKCTTSAADRYFVDLEVPAEGTHCPAVPPEEGSSSAMAKLAAPQLGWQSQG